MSKSKKKPVAKKAAAPVAKKVEPVKKVAPPVKKDVAPKVVDPIEEKIEAPVVPTPKAKEEKPKPKKAKEKHVEPEAPAIIAVQAKSVPGLASQPAIPAAPRSGTDLEKKIKSRPTPQKPNSVAGLASIITKPSRQPVEEEG